MDKRPYCGQSRVTTAHGVMAYSFEAGEEVEDQLRVKITQGERDGWLAVRSLCVLEQQPKRIALRRDGSWTGIPLLNQTIGKEALKQFGEFGRSDEKRIHRGAPWLK
jgi:hypothetical protein